MKPFRSIAATALVICALLLPLPAIGGVADCFGRDQDKATQCQLHVAGIYHALTTVQARYGVTMPACQFPPELEPGPLVERLALDLRENHRFSPDMHMNVIVAASVLQSKNCTMGVATEPHGYRAAGLLHQCQADMKGRNAKSMCSAYLKGLYEGLQQFSGFGDSRQFTCPPSTGPRVRDILLLFIDEAIRDPEIQLLPAAEVLARAMARAFPCRTQR